MVKNCIYVVGIVSIRCNRQKSGRLPSKIGTKNRIRKALTKKAAKEEEAHVISICFQFTRILSFCLEQKYKLHSYPIRDI